MGDKITQTAQHAAVLRAKFLKAALESGAPPSLSHADAEPNTTRERFELSCGGHSPEIQRAHLEQLVEGAPEAITLLDAINGTARAFDDDATITPSRAGRQRRGPGRRRAASCRRSDSRRAYCRRNR